MTVSLEELKKRLEDKKVVSVVEPQAPEAICCFHMDDGSAFRLYATDLGFWVEDLTPIGSPYTSLDRIFREYENHVYYMDYKYPIEVSVMDSMENESITEIIIVAPDKRNFKALINKDSPDGVTLSTDKLSERIRIAAEMGSVWNLAFSKDFEIDD